MWRTDGQSELRLHNISSVRLCTLTHKYIHCHRAFSSTPIRPYKCCRPQSVSPNFWEQELLTKTSEGSCKISQSKHSLAKILIKFIPSISPNTLSSPFPPLSSFKFQTSLLHWSIPRLAFVLPGPLPLLLLFSPLLSLPGSLQFSAENGSFITLAGNNLPKALSNESTRGILTHTHSHACRHTYTRTPENQLELAHRID